MNPYFSALTSPLFLPDIGTFFNQDIAQAMRMIDGLKEAGIKVVKGEILHRADVCLKSDFLESYLTQEGQAKKENYRQLIERKTVPLSAYKKIIEKIKAADMQFVLSVYDFEGADFAREMGALSIKVASSNIVHRPLIEHIVKLELPVLVDTGRSSMEDIARMVNWLTDLSVTDFCLEHSPAPPPTSVSEHNLRFMQTMGQAFNCSYGLSDHHAGTEMCLAAAVLGAKVIEKGVYLERADDQDVYHGMPVSGVKSLLNQIQMVSSALGSGVKVLRRDRVPYSSRMGLVAKRNLKAGEVLNAEDLDYAFPVAGICVEHTELALGFALTKSLSLGEPITWSHLGRDEHAR